MFFKLGMVKIYCLFIYFTCAFKCFFVFSALERIKLQKVSTVASMSFWFIELLMLNCIVFIFKVSSELTSKFPKRETTDYQLNAEGG